jgi:DNA-binding transcriptional ArsR family regulator
VEQPILRLGLLGFPEPAGLRLQHWAGQTLAGWPEWRCCDPHLADAWMIDGASVEVLGRDEVVIRHPHGSDERLTLNRAEVDRPLAFATPLPEGFASAEFFEAAEESSVRQRLQRFEAWLRPLRSQFALGAQLVERLPQFKQGGVVHLRLEDKLLAVIDIERWQVGLLIPARPVDLAMAEWIHKPGLAREVPPSFIRLSLHRVMWTYAVRTLRDVLPQRYRDATLYLRRVPRLPAHWLDEVHLQLMRELMAQPASLRQLQQRTGLPETELGHHLAALYHAGALSTDADSARRAQGETRRAMVALQFDQAGEGREVAQHHSGNSEQMAPSSILREAVHSPLRVSTGRPLGSSATVRPEQG